MAILFKHFRLKFLELIPLILLFFISLNGISVIDLNFFTVSLHFILVYYWVLREPKIITYGFIFLAGLINDVVYGIPLGCTPLALLAVSSIAAYARIVTVRRSLINDVVSFIPALLIGNFVYFLALYFSDFSIDYLYLFLNSIFTLIFYPILWIMFSILIRVISVN
tara:strand:- start:7233 stop:7730 length:498 start_codon:yes stop_codon:yes gene_type:complete